MIAAMAQLRDAFVRYPGRAVLDGCPHCRGPVPVDDHDLFSLAIGLGNTVGSRDDLKHLLPLLLERMVTSMELDPAIVLGKLPRERWRTWSDSEQDAIDGYLNTVWRSLLATYPSPGGSRGGVSSRRCGAGPSRRGGIAANDKQSQPNALIFTGLRDRR